MSEVTICLSDPRPLGERDSEAWRDEIRSYFQDDYEFIDPLASFDVPRVDLDVIEGGTDPDNPETASIHDVVERATDAARTADGVLVGYTEDCSDEAPQEMLVAYDADKYVVLWVRDDTDFDEIPPRYRHHATAITTDPELGLHHIRRRTLGEGVVAGD